MVIDYVHFFSLEDEKNSAEHNFHRCIQVLGELFLNRIRFRCIMIQAALPRKDSRESTLFVATT